jgi:LVIVD repeat
MSKKDEVSRTGQPQANLNRRALLTGGAALAGLAAFGARAQVTGLMPGGGTVPFRLPLGALTYLDRKEYIHNMQLIVHVKDARISGGEPQMNMWAKGERRLLQSNEGWLDVTDAKKPVTLKTKARTNGCVAYNEKLKKWLMMSTAAQPLTSANPEHPYGRWDDDYRKKAESYDGLRGVRTYDVTNPEDPRLLCEFSTGKTGSGTHMNFYDGGRYALVDAGWSDEFRMENAQRPNGNGFMLLDLSDPGNVKEASRWHWFAGDHASWTSSHGGLIPKRLEEGGRIAFCGFGHFGMLIMDLADPKNPKVISQYRPAQETMGGIPFHTIFPVHAGSNPTLQNLLIATAETVEPDCREPFKPVQVISVKDLTKPHLVGLFPRAVPPPEAPYTDFCLARGRFGTHNTGSWIAPGTARPELIVLACFNAGLQVWDISDPTQPREVAYFIPPHIGQMENYESWRRSESETAFVEWDRKIIWLSGPAGTYGLSCPALGTPSTGPRKIDNWTVQHANRGWDA